MSSQSAVLAAGGGFVICLYSSDKCNVPMVLGRAVAIKQKFPSSLEWSGCGFRSRQRAYPTYSHGPKLSPEVAPTSALWTIKGPPPPTPALYFQPGVDAVSCFRRLIFPACWRGAGILIPRGGQRGRACPWLWPLLSLSSRAPLIVVRPSI